MALTDEQWAALEPMIEACWPPAKVPPSHLRRTVSAIVWRHQNGAKWRAIPEEFGPWWMAAQTFIRWSRLGVWKRLLLMAQQRGVALGMTFLDGTSIRAHQKAGGRRNRWNSGATRRARGAWPLSRWLRHQGLRDRGRPRTGDCLCTGAGTGS